MKATRTDFFIQPNSPVTVTKMGQYLEIQYLSNVNHCARIRVLDKNHYLNLATGEVCERNHTSSRVENLDSIRQSRKRLIYQIKNNFLGADNELFVTLTFQQKVYDRRIVGKKLKDFVLRWRYYLKQHNYGRLRYIAVFEPHADGAWHIHMLMKFLDKKTVYIPNRFKFNVGTDNSNISASDFAKIQRAKLQAPLFDVWGNGVVSIKSLRGVEDVGAYLGGYLSNVPEQELLTEFGLSTDSVWTPQDEQRYLKMLTEVNDGHALKWRTSSGKRFAKGLRLRFYPTGCRLYTCSNCVPPQRLEMSYEEAVNNLGAIPEKLSYRTATFLDSEVSGFRNYVIKEQYNTAAEHGGNSILADREMYQHILNDSPDIPDWEKAYFSKELYEIEHHYEAKQRCLLACRANSESEMSDK